MNGKLGLLFASGLCACAVQAAGLTAANYVQDGLVTCFDGIDNAGTGAHVHAFLASVTDRRKMKFK